MTPPDLARYRTALENLRAETLDAGSVAIEPNRRDPATVGVADEDEQALSEMLQTLSSQRNRQRAERLAQIGRALRKIAESPADFGLCEDCEEEIPARRLDSMPWASFCAECQAKHDPRRGGARRSLTDFE